VKILVTGARTFKNRLIVAEAFDFVSRFSAIHGGPVVVIHGGAGGADTLCEQEARSRGWHTAVVKALWSSYGNSAGHIRNGVMTYLGAHEGCAFEMPCTKEDCPDPAPHITHGTANCLEEAVLAGIHMTRWDYNGRVK